MAYRDSIGTLKVNAQVLVSRLERVLADISLEACLPTDIQVLWDLEAEIIRITAMIPR